MSNPSSEMIRIDLLKRVARLRDLASQAKELASVIADPLARAGLEEHAADLERQAQGVAAQIAALVAAKDEPPEPNVTALRPPRKAAPLPAAEQDSPRARKRRR